jgi:hypothetical protein
MDWKGNLGLKESRAQQGQLERPVLMVRVIQAREVILGLQGHRDLQVWLPSLHQWHQQQHQLNPLRTNAVSSTNILTQTIRAVTSFKAASVQILLTSAAGNAPSPLVVSTGLSAVVEAGRTLVG